MGVMNDLVRKFIRFRENMGMSLSLDRARYIWGRKVVDELDSSVKELLDTKYKRSDVVERKVKYFKDNYKSLLFLNWVKFIGISGSVSAGFANDDDDIDVFIVVRDGCLWLYRGVLTLKGLFNGLFRRESHGESVMDMFCLNFIVEESGLCLDSDIFNFHELMFLVPVFNIEYLKYIYSRNVWLVEDFFVKKELLRSRVRKDRGVSWVFRFGSWLSFWFQFVYMLVFRHEPNLDRLRENTKKGRIEFFPEGYKGEVLEKK
jgi:hypothetical protein